MANDNFYESEAIRTALRIALIYAAAGAVWILLSDKLVAYFIKDMQLITQIQTYKGWGFILLTAILVFLPVRQQLKIIEGLNAKLQQRVNSLESFLPICSSCKKIRETDSEPSKMESWVQLESYITKKTSSQFSHGICPECAKKLYPDIDIYKDNKNTIQEVQQAG